MTSTDPTSAPSTLLIAGCGYLGGEVANQAKSAGWRVVGLTHTEESAAQIAARHGIETACADLTDPESLAALSPTMGKVTAAVHCASTKGGDEAAYRRIYVEGCQNLIDVFAPQKLVFTSSTSVFGQTDGSLVNEQSETIPASATGRVLLEAEEVALAGGGAVARLAGIYGPGRSVLLRKFFDGSATIDEGVSRMINQIHRDDAAAAVLHLLDRDGVFNVADNEPIAQPELMAWLAETFDQAVPPTAPRRTNKKRGWSNKAVSNQKLRETSWQPRYASFRSAVENDDRLVPSIRQALSQ